MLHESTSDLEIFQDPIEIVIQLLNSSRLTIRVSVALHHLLLTIWMLMVLVMDMCVLLVLRMGYGRGVGRGRPLGRGSGRKGGVNGCAIVWAILLGRDVSGQPGG